jgi:hypothetical protein
MNGVYTNLAKKRVDQSTELLTQGSVAPPPEKPSVKKAQDKKAMPVPLQTPNATKLSPASSDAEKVEKYTTHLEPSLVKKIKLAAIEKDIKDYEIVRLALTQYFKSNKE